ncbi:hypothetical protein SLEP1_g27866 [Rubroshorea leprosula]|uniref:Uncharacterized protein n=1 Tax=Rubroshorea leprosula TaxID=152421 RepID=A0AAV5K2L2_9ROSI|nr:hypothetical protein SLEP1_g27866 [Rubroshorea leprosula]
MRMNGKAAGRDEKKKGTERHQREGNRLSRFSRPGFNTTPFEIESLLPSLTLAWLTFKSPCFVLFPSGVCRMKHAF